MLLIWVSSNIFSQNGYKELLINIKKIVGKQLGLLPRLLPLLFQPEFDSHRHFLT